MVTIWLTESAWLLSVTLSTVPLSHFGAHTEIENMGLSIFEFGALSTELLSQYGALNFAVRSFHFSFSQYNFSVWSCQCLSTELSISPYGALNFSVRSSEFLSTELSISQYRPLNFSVR